MKRTHARPEINGKYYKIVGASPAMTVFYEEKTWEKRPARFKRSGLRKSRGRRFFSKGIDDPKFRLLKFHTIEATFWIEGKFRTCKYK